MGLSCGICCPTPSKYRCVMADGRLRQVAAVKHLHSRYGRDPRQWSQSGQQLAAFLFGVASHMIADINWHGLGEDWPAWRVPPGRGYLKVGCPSCSRYNTHSTP